MFNLQNTVVFSLAVAATAAALPTWSDYPPAGDSSIATTTGTAWAAGASSTWPASAVTPDASAPTVATPDTSVTTDASAPADATPTPDAATSVASAPTVATPDASAPTDATPTPDAATPVASAPTVATPDASAPTDATPTDAIPTPDAATPDASAPTDAIPTDAIPTPDAATPDASAPQDATPTPDASAAPAGGCAALPPSTPTPTPVASPDPSATGSATPDASATPAPSSVDPQAPSTVSLTGVTHSVVAGLGGLHFDPDNVVAQKGDVVRFLFLQSNHSVAQSTFDEPCKPSTNGFFPGFRFPTAAGLAPNVFELVIEDDTTPIWYYCPQIKGNHCQAGMAGVINQNFSSNKTLAAYKAAAALTGVSEIPDVNPNVGNVLPNPNPLGGF